MKPRRDRRGFHRIRLAGARSELVAQAHNRINEVTYRFGGGEIRENGRSKTNFAWSLQGGVAYAVMQNVKPNAGYRCIDLGKFETGGASTVGPAPRVEGDVRAHEVKVAVRYQF